MIRHSISESWNRPICWTRPFGKRRRQVSVRDWRKGSAGSGLLLSRTALVNDVVIGGDFERPWNAKSDAGRLAPGIPKERLWAYKPEGINQVGCIYTAQGFEFDYVGVIFGTDLVYDSAAAQWRGDRDKSMDTVVKRSGASFLKNVKNTYRVLLSRGIKGCYVYFTDKETEKFFRSRMEHSGKNQ